LRYIPQRSNEFYMRLIRDPPENKRKIWQGRKKIERTEWRYLSEEPLEGKNLERKNLLTKI